MSKKLKIIIPIIIVLLLIGGIAWGVYAFFANTPKNTYLKSEQQTAKMYKDYFNDRFENEVKFQEKMKDNSFLSSLELSADASDEIVKGLGIPKSVVNASKIKMSYGHDPKKEKSMINLEPTIADSALGKFQLAADKDKHYFESPLFKGKYADKKGVDIYYISDRDKEKDLKATQKNLKQQGIPQAKKSHILLKGKDDKSKESR
ncbi:HAD family acid phosphatase, partial [Staphylococcus aureus]|uniref:HAD family acid phosphatase n=1 Tax=Staphylococcus aureus TaxID=1280 RepID=UPI00298F26C6